MWLLHSPQAKERRREIELTRIVAVVVRSQDITLAREKKVSSEKERNACSGRRPQPGSQSAASVVLVV